MGDLWTENERLVALYDVECASRHDHDFYLHLASELEARSVIDVGCGTGVFGVDLAERGHVAIGIDPAEPMLDIARSRPGGDLVQWIHGDADDGPTGNADLIVMMGHVAQYFVDDQHWADTLVQLRRMLAPGGRITFEARNPRLGWRDHWTREKTTTTYAHPDGGTFTSWVQVVDVVGTSESYRMTHEGHSILPGGDHLSSSETLRFRSLEEIHQSLNQAGFEVDRSWGDWDRSALTDTSTEFIILARQATGG